MVTTSIHGYLGNSALASSAVAGQRLARDAISNLCSFCFCKVLRGGRGEDMLSGYCKVLRGGRGEYMLSGYCKAAGHDSLSDG